MRELGQRHEAYALVRVLLEYRDVRGRTPPERLARHQLAEIGNLLPRDDAAADGIEQISLLVHDRLLLERRNDPIRARDHRVVELAPRPRNRSLLKDALVAGDDRGH